MAKSIAHVEKETPAAPPVPDNATKAAIYGKITVKNTSRVDMHKIGGNSWRVNVWVDTPQPELLYPTRRIAESFVHTA